MNIQEIRKFFLAQNAPWLFEIKDQRMNENDIYVFEDRLIHRVFLVWHMIENPGHWRAVSNKGDNFTLPDDLARLMSE